MIFELVKKQYVIPFLPTDQSLGRAAGRQPAADQGIEIGLGIDTQDDDAQRSAAVLFVEDGDQNRQIDALVVIVTVKILKVYLTRPQDFGYAL